MKIDELQELRDWAARKMGWYKGVNDWWLKYGSEKQPDVIALPVRSIYNEDGECIGIKQDHWLPDRPESGQIWIVLEAIKKERFSVRNAFIKNLERIIADKYAELDGAVIEGLWNLFYLEPVDILKAYKATEEDK